MVAVVVVLVGLVAIRVAFVEGCLFFKHRKSWQNTSVNMCCNWHMKPRTIL